MYGRDACGNNGVCVLRHDVELGDEVDHHALDRAATVGVPLEERALAPAEVLEADEDGRHDEAAADEDRGPAICSLFRSHFISRSSDRGSEKDEEFNGGMYSSSIFMGFDGCCV